MKNLIIVLLLALPFQILAQVKKYIRKAENAVYSGDFQKAKTYYLKALTADKDNYKANLGAGLTMAYSIEDLEGSLPYLESALRLSPAKDTSIALIYALGKTYHYFGRYEEATLYYQRMLAYEEPGNDMYEPELSKRIADCKYALANKQITPADKLYVVNAGKTINTNMPEYVPVLIGDNKMIFTSKRQDDPKEKINKYNGKYYESMYISDINNGYTSSPARYVLPKDAKQKNNSNVSVISSLPEKRKIFIYKNQQLYEGDLSADLNEPNKISKTINFDNYQNHAFMGGAGDVLYFTSESGQGTGGNDIYRSLKNTDGTWGAPENLGEPINTLFEEEAPFISADGKTLYFASTGHPGYGGFDIYKSTLENGKWSVPENLGQPLNSPANDLFYISSSDGSVGYMSSSRAGGQGDMDIYKVNYTELLPKDCKELSKGITILANAGAGGNNYTFSVTPPEGFNSEILSFALSVNDSILSTEMKEASYTFTKKGPQTVKAKLVAWCDTCVNLYIACAEKQIDVMETEILASTSVPALDLKDVHGELSTEQLKALGFDISPILFQYNSEALEGKVLETLEKNMKVLQTHPELEVVITGYADSRGAERYNEHLSKKRADKVKAFLSKKSIPNRILSEGKGESVLMNECKDGVECSEDMHSQNRRVEFKVRKK